MTEALSPALRAVSDAVLAVASELSVEEVLQRLVDRARELVGARYAALGIPDGDGGFTRFLVAGMSDELIAEMGPLPRTHGMLGAMLEASEPFRTDDIHDRPAISRLVAGSPPGHALVPGRADRRGRGRDRRLLSDREGGAPRFERRRPGDDRAAGGARGDRDHQRPPVRARAASCRRSPSATGWRSSFTTSSARSCSASC